MSKNYSARKREAENRLKNIRRQIIALDFICSGTLLRRTKVCGKPGCACAKEASARHGPYYEWSRREANRLVHTVLSPSLAISFERAVQNYRRVLKLLRKWEHESVRIMMEENLRKP